MGSFSNYAENSILDHIFKTAEFTAPANIYVALSLTDPTEDGSGITEPSAVSYARVLCNVWNYATNRQTANTNQLIFSKATSSWGTITHFALFDALTGGNMLAYGSLQTQRVIAAGQTTRINSGAIVISFPTGAISTYLANSILRHVFKVEDYTPPVNIYAGLSTSNPGDTGAGLVEPSGNGYSRIVHNAWSAAINGVTVNSGSITFPSLTGSWGTLTHQFLTDATSGGNLLVYSQFSSPEAPVSGDALAYDSGDLQITCG